MCARRARVMNSDATTLRDEFNGQLCFDDFYIGVINHGHLHRSGDGGGSRSYRVALPTEIPRRIVTGVSK